MPELSPAAQAVLDAYENSYTESGLVAALRAAADQVVPENPPDATYEFCCDYTQLRTQETVRRHFLAIADELESQ